MVWPDPARGRAIWRGQTLPEGELYGVARPCQRESYMAWPDPARGRAIWRGQTLPEGELYGVARPCQRESYMEGIDTICESVCVCILPILREQ